MASELVKSWPAWKQNLLGGIGWSSPRPPEPDESTTPWVSPKLIAIEGIDGSGKTTLARTLADLFANTGTSELRLTREPYDPPPPGKDRGRIREALMSGSCDPTQLAVMFAADRFAHLEDVVRPAMEAGSNVLCDRYLLSTIAYQTLALPEEFVLELTRPAPAPDLTILLDMDPVVAASRMAARGIPLEAYERKLSTQIELRERYLDYASRPDIRRGGHVFIVPAVITAGPPERLAAIVALSLAIYLRGGDPNDLFPAPPTRTTTTTTTGPTSESGIYIGAAKLRDFSRVTEPDVARTETPAEAAERRARSEHAAVVADWAFAGSPSAMGAD